MACMRTNLTFLTILREPSLNKRGIALRKVRIRGFFWWNYGSAFVWIIFHNEKKNALADAMVSCCIVNWGLTFSTSEFLYPNNKIKLGLIRARPIFYMISDSSNVNIGIVVRSFYTRRIALKDDYHKKRLDVIPYTPVEFSNMEFLAKTFIIPARQNQFSHENIFNNAHRIAIAVNTNSPSTGPCTENPFWYQQFDLRQSKTLRPGPPIVDFDAAQICCLYVTTMKAMNFQDDIPSIPIGNFKDKHLLVFDLTSIQDSTETSHYPELVGEPQRLELNFTFPLEHVTEIIVLGEWMSSMAVIKFGVPEKKYLNCIMFLSIN